MQLIIVLTLVQAGALVHYVVSWANGKVTCSFEDYCLRSPKSTALALCGTFIATITFMASGSFDGSMQSVALAVLAGYTSDSALNKA